MVSGIGGYGNSVGVATVGGETHFDSGYDGNILVNAFTLGIVKRDKIFRARAAGPGNPVLYIGSKTGRDGIHGASLLASSEFKEESEQMKPTVFVTMAAACSGTAISVASGDRRRRDVTRSMVVAASSDSRSPVTFTSVAIGQSAGSSSAPGSHGPGTGPWLPRARGERTTPRASNWSRSATSRPPQPSRHARQSSG